jgi:TPR repeat protein
MGRRAAERAISGPLPALPGCEEDEEAARWFRRGAGAGDLGAQHDYALLLLQGRGVIKDEQAAARCALATCSGF